MKGPSPADRIHPSATQQKERFQPIHRIKVVGSLFSLGDAVGKLHVFGMTTWKRGVRSILTKSARHSKYNSARLEPRPLVWALSRFGRLFSGPLRVCML